MASSRAKTKKVPVRMKLADGTNFACSCKSTEFKVTDGDKPCYFCRCGQVYTDADLQEG